MKNTGLIRILLGSVCGIFAACAAGGDLADDDAPSDTVEIASLTQGLVAADRAALIINVDSTFNTTPTIDPPWPTGMCLEGLNGGLGGQPIRLNWCGSSNEQRWAFEPSTGRIINAQSGLCLQTRLYFPANGTKLMAATCDSSSPIQRWEHTINGTFRQKSSGKCIDLEVTSAGWWDVGSLAQVWICNTGGGQKWRPWNSALKSAASGRCLDVNASNADQVQIWDCQGSANQAWALLFGSTLGGIVTNEGTGRCLTATGSSAGSAVVMRDCNRSGSQTFAFREDGSLYNSSSRLCLDVANNGTGNGASLQLWTCHGGANQRWSTR